MRHPPQEIERRLQDLTERCRKAGKNVTPQRLAIYRELLRSDDHPSPETLYKRVKPRLRTISLATIYKALDALAELEVVKEVSAISETKRYDANLDRHHHLICTECKAIIDVYDASLDAIPPPKKLGGFVPHTLSVEVLGVCAACAKRAPPVRAR